MSICDSRLLDPNFQEISFPNIGGVEFRYVPDSDQLYCISINGKVFSRLGGRGIIKNEWHEIKHQPSKDNYPFVSISKRGKQDMIKLHILLLETFVSSRPDGMLGLHKDDNRWNFELSNLYWGTYNNNADDRSRNGSVIGETHGMAKLTEKAVLRARELRKQGLRNSPIRLKIIEEFNIDVHESMISHAIIGRTWKYLPI